jgi:hypothetical protein
MIPLNIITTYLENDLIGGLFGIQNFGCDLDQIKERFNKNAPFLDLVFTNVPVDMAVEGAVNLRLWRIV